MQRLVIAILAVALVGGCARKQDASPEAAATPPAIAVEVMPAVEGTIQAALSLSGDIRSARETPVAAKVGGRLEFLTVAEGTRVRAGQEIGRIDPVDYRLQVLQAEATLAAATASRASAATNHATAADNHRRLQAVHAEGGLSDQQLVAARSQANAASNAVRAAEAQIAQARAAVALAKSQLGNTSIKAPYAGVVTKKSAEVGTMLAPMTPVATVAAIGELELKVPVGQAQLESLRVGAPATFTVPTYPGRTFTARVVEIAPTVDPRTRTKTVTLRIPNPEGALSPGMFARVSLPITRKEDAVLVPADALLTQGEDFYVFVVEGDRAVRRKVSLGLRQPDRVEVTAGVRPGDRIVTLGKGQLQEGDPVRIVEPGKTAEPSKEPPRESH